jgi:hypothetical protein
MLIGDNSKLSRIHGRGLQEKVHEFLKEFSVVTVFCRTSSQTEMGKNCSGVAPKKWYAQATHVPAAKVRRFLTENGLQLRNHLLKV